MFSIKTILKPPALRIYNTNLACQGTFYAMLVSSSSSSYCPNQTILPEHRASCLFCFSADDVEQSACTFFSRRPTFHGVWLFQRRYFLMPTHFDLYICVRSQYADIRYKYVKRTLIVRTIRSLYVSNTLCIRSAYATHTFNYFDV